MNDGADRPLEKGMYVVELDTGRKFAYVGAETSAYSTEHVVDLERRHKLSFGPNSFRWVDNDDLSVKYAVMLQVVATVRCDAGQKRWLDSKVWA